MIVVILVVFFSGMFLLGKATRKAVQQKSVSSSLKTEGLPSTQSMEYRLEELSRLKSKGLVSEEEYGTLRSKIISGGN